MTHGQKKKQLRESNPEWPKCWNQQTRILKQLQKFCLNGLTKGQIPVEKYQQKNENYFFNPSGNFWVLFCSQVCQMPQCFFQVSSTKTVITYKSEDTSVLGLGGTSYSFNSIINALQMVLLSSFSLYFHVKIQENSAATLPPSSQNS